MTPALQTELAKTLLQPIRFALCSLALLPALVLGANVARTMTPVRLDRDGDRATFVKEAQQHLDSHRPAVVLTTIRK